MFRCRLPVAFLLLVWLSGAPPAGAAYPRSGRLEIHFINVAHALSTLVIGPGPDGAVVLMDAGKAEAREYLEAIGFVAPVDALPGEEPDYIDFTIASHLHSDHIRTFDEIFAAGFLEDPAAPPGTSDSCRNCFNGSDYSWSGTVVTAYRVAAAATRANGPHKIEVGRVIPLGEGATLTVLACRGEVLGSPPPAEWPDRENDRSVAVLIQYGDFQFIWAGDLGGGEDDCCGHDNDSQENLESAVAANIAPGGVVPLLGVLGVDVLHVNHHGSETSTNHDWMNTLEPELAVISVGRHGTHKNPMVTVVDNVLMAQSECVTAPPALVLQTDESYLDEPDPGSPSGFTVGDILVTTDGVTYDIDASGASVLSGGDELGAAGLLPPKAEYRVDDATPGCPMIQRIALSPPWAVDADEVRYAKHSITTLAPYEVAAGVSVTFEAGRTIALGDGFVIDRDSTFTAVIEPLTDCS